MQHNVHNCVRVTHLQKMDELCRHFDTVLQQIEARTGPVARRNILIEPRRPPRPDDDDTIVFIQLVDQTKHDMLIYMLNDYRFHSKYLKAEYATYNFRILEDFRPFAIKCHSCSNYGDKLIEREEHLKEWAIRYETKRIITSNAKRREELCARKAGVECKNVEVQTVEVVNAVVGMRTEEEVPERMLPSEVAASMDGSMVLVSNDNNASASPSIETICSNVLADFYDFYN